MMHLPTRSRRPFPVADRFRDGTLVESEHPRVAAVRHLRETIAAGRAGLDPFDRTLFVLVALPHELTWAYRALELCGVVIVAGEMDGGRRRLKAVLEADVRLTLGLDGPDPATMADEPLASRAVSAPTALMDAIFGTLPAAPPSLHVLESVQEPISKAAIERAKEAFDARAAVPHAQSPDECWCDDCETHFASRDLAERLRNVDDAALRNYLAKSKEV